MSSAPVVDRIVTVRELRQRTTLSRSTIWRMTRDGVLPRPVRLSAHRIGWLESDIAAWLKARKNQTIRMTDLEALRELGRMRGERCQGLLTTIDGLTDEDVEGIVADVRAERDAQACSVTNEQLEEWIATLKQTAADHNLTGSAAFWRVLADMKRATES